jgi:hypothetical protein
MFQSCLHITQVGLPPVARVMHPSFESLTITGTPCLHASFMDIHHNTSLRFILEDDSISSTFRTCICFCSNKGVGLWLLVKPYIRLFCIPHFTFTSTLCFCFGLIQPSIFNLFTCECGHKLDASSTHLIHCPFGGQWIAKHDAI